MMHMKECGNALGLANTVVGIQNPLQITGLLILASTP